jgi:serine/threonine-protein kinase
MRRQRPAAAVPFGRYVLVEPVAQGGMAELWRAKLKDAAGFERKLVLKRVLPHLAGERSYVEMFLREARLSARLDHPNLVHVFEFGESDGAYFLTMEHVDGVDLADVMAARSTEPMPVDCVAFIGFEIARALHYVHELADEQGRPLRMIHRDVTPSNIMITREGVVKLVDFGVAKALASSEQSAIHLVKGKIAYLAPEQITLRRADHRSDLFTVGITLYELLTGVRLFKRDNDRETVRAVLHAPILPPSLFNPVVPPALDEIVLRALERVPESRWPSAQALAEVLAPIVQELGAGPAPLRALLQERFEEEPAPASAEAWAGLHAHDESDTLEWSGSFDGG